jgi:hypothetical protein
MLLLVTTLTILPACGGDPSCARTGGSVYVIEDWGCCEGRVPYPERSISGVSVLPAEDGTCPQIDDDDVFEWVCLACGDGTCDPELETYCNCPDDCPAPA